jgi:hypothetical protein
LEKASQLRQDRSPEPAVDAFTGGDVLSQSRAFQVGIHKKADRFWSAPAGWKKQASCGKIDHQNQPWTLSREVMCCRNRAPFKWVFTKKRTGFGPQQASFGYYVSTVFGGYVRSSELTLVSDSFNSD